MQLRDRKLSLKVIRTDRKEEKKRRREEKKKRRREDRITCIITNAPSNIHNMRRMPRKLEEKEMRKEKKNTTKA